MIFKHESNLEQFPELPVSNINGLRFYEAPNGNKYPSITTVLGKQPGKQKGLQAWRDRIGHEAAGIISGKAARRGTAFHNICEDYLNNQDISDHKGKNFLSWCMFGEVRDYLDKSINTIVLQETNMFSDKYKVAGRTDCIAEYDNDGLAVIDFKTTTTPKKREWIDDYFIQCSAYAFMFEEHTGISVPNVVIIIVAEDGEVQIYKEKSTDYAERLETMMDDFYQTLNLADLAA